MSFATTEHLNLRAYRDSDIDLLLALWNDPRVQMTGTNDYNVPRSTKWATDVLVEQMQSSLLAVIIEVKEVPLDSVRPESGVACPRNVRRPGDEDRWPDDEKFVGYLLLQMGTPKNRDANLAIALLPGWWGHGFGTEAVRWGVNYGFHNLGLHRVSLAVMDGNERAIQLYKNV
jgi:RimJ/RimL family protein N-acetyltransferase